MFYPTQKNRAAPPSQPMNIITELEYVLESP